MRRMVTNNKGFSLVELMVVVAIIGILAAIAVPNFQKFTAKSKQSEAKSELAAIYSAERAFSAEWNTFFEDFRNIGYQPTGDLRYNHGFNGVGSVSCPQGYNGTGTNVAKANEQAGAYNTENPLICNKGGGALANNSAASAVQCRLLTNPLDPSGKLPASTVDSATTFLASAAGDIDGDATYDTWTINQTKELQNTIDDVTQ